MTTETAEISEKQSVHETKTISAVLETPMSPAAANGENGSAKVAMGRNGGQNHFAAVATLIRANGSRPSIVIPSMIIKRDGRIVPFDIGRIESALTRCFNSLNRTPSVPVEELAQQVVNIIAAKHPAPSVEDVQDIVEMVLQAAGEYEAAKHYILYRAEHAKLRVARPIPDEVREAFQASDRHFPTQLQKFQFYDKYSRFSYEAGRRETWIETVDRSVAYLAELSQQRLPAETYERVRRGILDMSTMPSMRLLAMAGPAARRNNITIYNCSYQPVESIDSFVEALIISMSGCGVGYSVEHRYVENFPRIRRQTGATALPYTVEDSAEGWADALRTGLATWFEGGDLRFDLSQLRPAGAPLRTKGGRASGPEPLRRMLEFARGRILARQGNFLRPLDAHDIMCAVGGAAVSGGMRRTAMISLFDLDDEEMLQCKSGDFERNNSQRWNANNSAVWPDRELTQLEIARFMLDMIESGRGEPGIFSRRSANALRPERRAASDFGTNPCVTGETWIAVADGRGRVQIRDLAAEGKDVDVYTVKDNNLVIRTMRNPRKTGTQTPVYRVTFADGSYVRATLNHRFVMLDGSEKTTAELQPKDALKAMMAFSYQKKGLPAVVKCNYDAPNSYRMLQFGSRRKSEHRQIYAHHTGVELKGIEYQLHHRDFDGRNNHISNLQLMTVAEHAAEHRARMLGQDNPAVRLMNDTWRKNLSDACAGAVNGNAKEISNEQLEAELIALTRKIGRALLRSEYTAFAQANNWPRTWQAYRRDYFGGDIRPTLQRFAHALGLPVMEAWEVEARRFTDLPLRQVNGRTEVQKACEVCGAPFWVSFSRREQAACSQPCSQKLYYRLHGTASRRTQLKQAHNERKEGVRELQVKIYNDLLSELNRHPAKREWEVRCREMGISPEVSRASSPFRSWVELGTAATATNHRVVSVTPDGCEDVYTGTVDETHTFFSIGSERSDAQGRVEMGYVLSWQCGEINLRPWEFCNLTAAVARANDTPETLRSKVEIATIIGTIQSMATHFPGLRPMWRQNCEEERLLGVDITGQMDCPVVQDPRIMAQLKHHAVQVNRQVSELLGINPSVSISCVKPSGNTSQLVDCASGLHARWAPYYVRNVRVSAHSPVFKVLRDASVPMDPENGQTPQDADTWVVHFPVKSPDSAITRRNRSALAQCEYWLQNKLYYTEHNPSVTVTYHDDEVLELIKWVWEHQDVIGGMAFLPSYDAQYDQMPYEEISAEAYERLAASFPDIDFSKLFRYEEEDLTTAAQELACMAGACEVAL